MITIHIDTHNLWIAVQCILTVIGVGAIETILWVLWMKVCNRYRDMKCTPRETTKVLQVIAYVILLFLWAILNLLFMGVFAMLAIQYLLEAGGMIFP